MKKGDDLFILKRDKGKGVFYDAINAYNAAMLIYPEKADSARQKIKEVFDEIQKISEENINLTNQARKDLKAIMDANKTAEDRRKEAEAAKNRVYLFNLANAPYKYVRKIRDGPKDGDKIEKEKFDSNLIAYSTHLDFIRDTLNQIPDSVLKIENIPQAKWEYAQLRDNLDYNNDLYEKIYFCLDFHGAKEEVLVNSPLPDSNYFRFQQFKGEQETYYISADSVVIKLKNYSREDSSFSREGQKFTSITIADTLKSIICATDDHYIFVFKPGPEGNPIKIDTIAMGTQVTAIDFIDSSKIIFFGTKGGDIGFIKYDENERKYQPVYSTENYFSGSTITAIDFFVKDGDRFMLVAGFDGKAVVYKVDSNFLVEGYKFSGNILPDPRKELGNILHASFYKEGRKVMLETTNGFYLWDPFTESVLEKYRRRIDLKGKELENILLQTKFY